MAQTQYPTPYLEKSRKSKGMMANKSHIMTPLNNLYYVDGTSGEKHLCKELFVEDRYKNQSYRLLFINRTHIEAIDFNLDEEHMAYLRIDNRKGLSKNK